MSKTLRNSIIGFIVIWLLYVSVTSTTAAKNLGDKLALMAGKPTFKLDFNQIRQQSFPIEFNNIQIINQTPFGATVSNLFVNVQYLSKSTNTWQNWIMQREATIPFEIRPSGVTILPSVKLTLPLTLSLVSSIFTGDISPRIRVVANFTFYGISISIDDETDLTEFFNYLKRFNWEFK